MPDWVYDQLNEWMKAAHIETGKVFRRVSSAGRPWGEEVTEKLVWHVVKEFAAKTGASKLAPHDPRRTCARLCRAAGGELEGRSNSSWGTSRYKRRSATSVAPSASLQL